MTQRYVSPEFLIALRNNSLRRDALRNIVKGIPTTAIFEACCRGEITSAEAADIIMLQRESNYWIVRFLKQLWYLI